MGVRRGAVKPREVSGETAANGADTADPAPRLPRVLPPSVVLLTVLGLDQALERVVHLAAHAHGLGEGGGAADNNHQAANAQTAATSTAASAIAWFDPCTLS